MTTFTWIPSPNSQLDEEPRVRSAPFGDGYEQRVGDGINNDLQKWSLRFDTRMPAEAAAIRDFLKTHAGVTPFDWTSPLGDTSKYICRSWSMNAASALIYDVSAVFEEVPE